MLILINSVFVDNSNMWMYFLRFYRISSCFSPGFWLTVLGSSTLISGGLFSSRLRTSIYTFCYVLNIFFCIEIIIDLSFHEIFYYNIRFFVVAL